MISRDDVFAACKENLLRRIIPVFSPRCRGFFRFLALAAPCAGASFSGRFSRARIWRRSRASGFRLSEAVDSTGMGGDGKSRRGAFAVGFFGRASARPPRRDRGFDGARARAKRRHEKTSFCGKIAFRFPINRASSIGMTVFFSARSKLKTTPRGRHPCRHNRHHKRQLRPQRAEFVAIRAKRSGKNYRKPRNANSSQSQLSPAIKEKGERKWWPKLPANAPNTRWCCRPPTDRSI